MSKSQTQTAVCQCCKQLKKLSELLPAEAVREPLVAIIKAQYPEWSPSGFICLADLRRLRNKYVETPMAETC